MDKLVRRVTVVEGSGQNRVAKVVYKSEADEDEDNPRLHGLEQSLRHLLKAQVIAAQDAYQRHLESVEKGGMQWLQDGPRNLMKANRKAMKEMRKAVPKMPDMGFGDDDEEE
jgi:hypothetical protein